MSDVKRERDVKRVARHIAAVSGDLVPTLIRDETLPNIVTRAGAEAAIDAVVTQDPDGKSKRVWAAVFAVATAVLAVPEVQAYLGPWAPVVTAALSAALAGWSKAADPRPVR